MMKKYLLNLVSSSYKAGAANPNYKIPSLGSFHIHNFYSSKSDASSENPNSYHPENEIHPDDVSSAELKSQIDKFYKGDFEAIPDIFESILKRKLSGNHQDSDDELMNEFRQGQPNVSDVGQDFDSSSDSDSD